MNPAKWRDLSGSFGFEDITYHINNAGNTLRIAFNRPECLNAFQPKTVDELLEAFDDAKKQNRVGCVLLTGNGPSKKHNKWAFCTGGDQRARGFAGYEDDSTAKSSGRLHILDVQRQIRFLPKVVIAVVNGWAVGGGHSLHVTCDLSLASKEHAIFKQTDADVASFDAAFGSAYLAKNIGQKRAREIFFLGDNYSAKEAFEMGMVNKVIEHQNLEDEALNWANKINKKSPTAIRMLKYAMNLPDDGLIGQQLFAGEATRLAYGTDEALEGRNAFLEKRPFNFDAFDWQF